MNQRRLGSGLICLLGAAAGCVDRPGTASTAVAPLTTVQVTGVAADLMPVLVAHDISPPLRNLAPIPPRARSEVERELHRSHRILPPQPGFVDPVAQTLIGPAAIPGISQSFDGLGEGFPGFQVQYVPPDPNGDVGPNHYVQIVNASLAILSKTGARLYGPASINTVFSGLGSLCESNNDGDPVVKYDQLADRWLISQFALPAPQPTTPSYECLAVSTGPDPTGSYHRYAYQFTTFADYPFGDYPKWGIWIDGYYLSANMYQGTVEVGAVCAFERNAVTSGGSIQPQCFRAPGYDTMLVANIQGRALPPAGTPAYVLSLNNSALAFWKLHVDWSTPASSTLSGPTGIPTMPFSAPSAVPQPGIATTLDALADRLMFPVAYRKFADHESLVANHTAGSGTRVGVRWYEIRDPGGTPTIFQQGTYMPDGDDRWMGSIGIDHVGDIGLGFTVSSGAHNPSLHYAGRLVDDPPGMLAQGEGSAAEGGGVQTDTQSPSRWGDYASLGVDPTDDCTFWFTGEYMGSTGDMSWRTRIASFKFQSCTANDGSGGSSGGVDGGVGGSGGAGGGSGGGGGGGGGNTGGGGGDSATGDNVVGACALALTTGSQHRDAGWLLLALLGLALGWRRRWTTTREG